MVKYFFDSSFELIIPSFVLISRYKLIYTLWCFVFFYLFDPDTRGERRIKIVYPIFFNGIFLYLTYTCMFIFFFFFLTSFLQMLLGEFRWIPRVLLGFGHLYYFSALLCARVGLERRSNQLKLCFYICCCCFGAKTRGLIEF